MPWTDETIPADNKTYPQDGAAASNFFGVTSVLVLYKSFSTREEFVGSARAFGHHWEQGASKPSFSYEDIQ